MHALPPPQVHGALRGAGRLRPDAQLLILILINTTNIKNYHSY